MATTEKQLTCKERGEHYYFALNYTFARDEKGVAFKGPEWHQAAKFVTLFCSRCGETKEVQSCPRLELRKPKFDKPKNVTVAAKA